MTLEDFFTLTEMKDGLTALSRVEELVTVMQKEKDSLVKNVGDASRQWTAVANTIAATENKDCLDLFIKLEGLLFIDKWLKDAQKFCTGADERFLEDSIVTLLQALEKLHIDNEKSISSGIRITVKDLLDHKSSMVQDRARILIDCWKQEKDDGAVNCEVEKDAVKKVEVSQDASSKLVSEDIRPSASSIPTSEETLKRDGRTVEPSGELTLPNVSPDLQSERSDGGQIDTQNNQVSTPKNFESAETKERAEDPLASSAVSNSLQENPCPMEDSSASSLGEAPMETSFVTSNTNTAEEQRDSPKEGGFSKLEKQEDKIEGSVSSPTESKIAQSDIDAEASQDFVKQLTLHIKELEANENEEHIKDLEADCAVASASDSKVVVGDPMVLSRCSAAEDGECCSDALQGSSLNGSMAGEEVEDLEKGSRMNDLETDDEDKEDGSDEDRDFRNAYEFSKPVSKRADATDKRRSNVELDFDVDALEVARRVAKAVEREVGDFKGTFCSSSSEKISEDESRQPGSPDSINEKQNPPSKTPIKEVTTAQSRSVDVANLDRAPDNCNHDLDSSQVTEAAQETEINAEKGLWGFDLNEDVCSDELDQPVNPVSTTISVSASRPTTAPGLPLAPLQFEGTLGWKGSAATSAFRPASPRRNSDSDKNPSLGGTSDGSSKQRQDWLDFDLNVAEGGGDDLVKQLLPALSGHPSGESSVEASPKRSERFKLDLNTIDDDGDVIPSNSRAEVQQRYMFNRNGHHHHRSPSPSSSSSSMQPSLRNFDLNDRPSFNDPQDQGPPLGKSSLAVNNAFFAVPKQDASVISIMGTRVEISNKKDTAAPQILSLSNGKAIVDPTVDASMMGTSSFLGLAPLGTYTHSPVFGYNGMTTAPPMSLPPALYGPGGPIPLMDSRATMMPQLVSSGSSVPPFSHPPFIVSMTNNAPVGLNGAGPSRPNFDLNSGFMVDGGNRDTGLRQFFVPGPGPGRPVEDHLRANSQPTLSSGGGGGGGGSSGGSGGKRKEPDSGWETFQFGYKQHQQQQHPWR